MAGAWILRRGRQDEVPRPHRGKPVVGTRLDQPISQLSDLWVHPLEVQQIEPDVV